MGHKYLYSSIILCLLFEIEIVQKSGFFWGEFPELNKNSKNLEEIKSKKKQKTTNIWLHLRTHAGQCDPAGPEKCQMRLIQKQLLWHLSASLLYYTLILYNETDEWTVTTSGVCIFTHFEEIMWGCIKMYCRWKGIFSKSHEHVTELLFFFLPEPNEPCSGLRFLLGSVSCTQVFWSER